MFLAWNEIKHSKLRYFLIIDVMVLIAYLVFFLIGLAYGLAQDNRTAVDKWQADAIVLTDEANVNMAMSMMPADSIDDVSAAETAVLGQSPSVAQVNGRSDSLDKINVSIFGIEPDSFIAPNVIDGAMFGGDYEAVVDNSMHLEDGVELGDLLYLAGVDDPIKVVGFTDNAKFSVSPVLYTSLDTFRDVRFAKSGGVGVKNDIINAVIVRAADHDVANVTVSTSDLKVYPVATYINKLPGYQAQVLTFGLMIGFLVVIAAVVIGIFIYVFTLQKAAIFGVMKAQGISNGYISKAVIIQTLLLAVLGFGLGAGLTLLTALFLPPAVPFRIETMYFIGLFLILVFSSVLGALFSVRTVVKVDPLKAIS